MLDVFTIVFPIYALIGIGFAMTRRGVFSEEDIRALGRFIVNLALPALVFTALAGRPLTETVRLAYVLVYASGTLTLIGLLYLGFRRGGYDHKTATLATMGSTCSNSGFIGYPIMLLAMPGLAAATLAQNVLVENTLFIPLLLTMLEVGNGGAGSRWQVARRITLRVLTGPLVMAMIVGVVVSLSGIPLPATLAKPVQMLAAASGAVSLVVIGGTLANLRPAGMRRLVAWTVAGKLVLHPLAMFLGVTILALSGALEVNTELRAALILTGAMPAMGIFPIVAQMHGREGFASAAMLGGTVVSLVTLSALLLILT